MALTDDNAIELIKSAHERQRLAHAFLIIGKHTDGTTKLVSSIVQLLNEDKKENVPTAGFDLFGEPTVTVEDTADIEFSSLEELSSPLVRVLKPEKKSRIISADAMRDFEKFFYTSAPANKWNIGIIAEADRLNDSSANAFLKTLEEPPKQTLLLLITDKPEQLLPTILSRCVNLKLIEKETKASESETQLIQTIASKCKGGLNSDITALQIKSVFTDILLTRREEISKTYVQALKDEQLQYGKSTDGSWLKDRENYYKARTEIDYLYERSQLMDTLVSWFGDILRKKFNFEHLDFPQLKKITANLAEIEETPSLIRRMDELEKMRDALTTNADEKLTLESGFLQTFG